MAVLKAMPESDDFMKQVRGAAEPLLVRSDEALRTGRRYVALQRLAPAFANVAAAEYVTALPAKTRTDDAARGLLGSWSGGDGSASPLAGAPGALPPRAADLAADRYRLVADKRFDEAARPWWSRGPSDVLGACGLTGAQVGAFVTNQASRARMFESAASAGIDAGAVVDVIGETANAGCASQLIAFDHARRDHRAGPGSVVMLSAVGGGINAVTLALRP